MNPALQTIIQLGELDTKLRRVASDRSGREEAIAEAKTGLAAAEAKVKAKHDEVATLQKEADALNLDVKTIEEHIAKLEGQQRQAKSNKEYDIFKKEIQADRDKIAALEDGVLERLERIDAVQSEEKAAQAGVEEAKKKVKEAENEAAEAEKEIASQEDDLKVKRDQIAETLEADIRSKYERLLAQRKDSAVAKVVGGSCSKCMRKITRQMEAMLDVGEEIVYCMSCARILYVDETAGVQ